MLGHLKNKIEPTMGLNAAPCKWQGETGLPGGTEDSSAEKNLF